MLGFVVPDFKEQPPSEAQITVALLQLWPTLIAYLLSFSVIGIMCQNHHALFRLIRAIDRRTVIFNLMLLAVTASIPFATLVLGAHPATRPATFLYGLTLTTSSPAYNVMLNHLIASGAFDAMLALKPFAVPFLRIGSDGLCIQRLCVLLSPADPQLRALSLDNDLLPDPARSRHRPQPAFV